MMGILVGLVSATLAGVAMVRRPPWARSARRYFAATLARHAAASRGDGQHRQRHPATGQAPWLMNPARYRTPARGLRPVTTGSTGLPLPVNRRIS